MDRISLTLFGGFRADVEGTPLPAMRRKAQALLAYLALSGGRPHPREKLTALLWGDFPGTRARHSLRQALTDIRGALPGGVGLHTAHDSVVLDLAGFDVDVVTFERLVRDGTLPALDEAARLYRGELLEGLDVTEPAFEEWLVTERARLHDTAILGLGRLLAHQIRAENTESAVVTASRLLALDPVQESVHRALMRLHVKQGRRGSALRQYQVCVAILHREFETDPEAETRQLYTEILRRQPVPLDAAAAERPGRRRAGAPRPRAAGDSIPLIGREPELTRALELLAEGRDGRVLAVLGETGIGKTRFVQELVGQAARHGRQTLIGRCYETVQMLPFAPWVEMLRQAEVAEDAALLKSLGPVWLTELRRLLPEIGTPGRRHSSAPEQSVRLFEAVAALLAQLAARQPLLVVVEDLHWGDEMSVALLSMLARRLAGDPVALVATARDEELFGVRAVTMMLQELERDDRLVTVRLPPLSNTESRALVRAHAHPRTGGQALVDLEERVWAACEGNPFMIVETLRTLPGALPFLTGAALPLPARVRDVIETRLERLSERNRQLVALAAVIGAAFAFSLLAAASGWDEREAAEGVEELVRRGILHGIGAKFGFSHERIREVAYDAILDVRRRALHRAVGGALETVYASQPETVYDRLAYHYSEADDPAKAAEYLARFARQATRTYAHAEAARAYGEALRYLDRLPPTEADAQRLDIVPRLTRSLTFLGRFEEARDLLLAQRDRVAALENPWLTAQFELLLAHAYAFLGDRERSMDSAGMALAAAESMADEATMGKALYLIAMEGYWSGQPEHGVAHGRRAVALLERTTERWWLGQAQFAVAANQVLAGDFEPARQAAARALAIGVELDDPRVRTPAEWLTGTIHAMRGDWDEGIAAGRRALDDSPDPLNTADALGWLGFSYLEQGDAATAVRLLEASVEQWSRFRLRPAQGGFRILLAHAYLLEGDVDHAERVGKEGLALTRETRYGLGIGWGQRLLGLIARMRSDAENARLGLEEALATFVSIGAGFEAARTRLLLAEVLWARDEAAATRLVAEARKAFEALAVPRYVRWSNVLAAGPHGPSAGADVRLPRWAPA